MKINIITHLNGYGLTKDANILKEAIIGHDVKIIEFKNKKTIRNARVNIFLELFDPVFLKFAPVNIMIPNPEWYMPEWYKQISKFNFIWCKTYDAANIFQKMGGRVEYIGFTSEDRSVDQEKKRAFFHAAGNSEMKGTKYVVRVWEETRNLPSITITSGKSIEHKSEQINVHKGYMDDEQFKWTQNRYQFHLCPSTYEGFGHYINEAKSCGAIIISTGAAPMNELVKEDFGVLCKPTAVKMKWLAKESFCTASSLQRGVFDALDMSEKEVQEKSRKARESFETSDREFRKILNQQLKQFE